MTLLLLKVFLLWLLMAAGAVLNGVSRDKLLTPWLGPRPALTLSGLSLSILIGVITYLTLPWLGYLPEELYLLIGCLWVALTMALEYLLGRIVLHQSWQTISERFNLSDGNLMILVLLVTAASPWCAARLLGMI